MTDTGLAVTDTLQVRLGGQRFRRPLADPPWRFQNVTGKGAPGHKRLGQHETLLPGDIKPGPLSSVVEPTSRVRDVRRTSGQSGQSPRLVTPG